MGGTVPRSSKGLPSVGLNNDAFSGRVLPQPAGAKSLVSSGGQRTMPVPGAPTLPVNPFPEIARRRIRLGMF
jgi:hypothetical protein